MLRRGIGVLPRAVPSTSLVARAAAVRGLSSSAALQLRRDDERVPRGHVRPRRRRIDTTNQEYEQQAQAQGHAGPGMGYGAGFGQQFGQQSFGSQQWGMPGSDGRAPQPSRRVDVPNDPQGILNDSHGAYELLAHDTLIIVRQLEMLNVFMGFEQANRYAIYAPDGNLVGYMAEEERGMSSVMTRQFLHTHRPFQSVVMDRHGTPILWIRRPFAFINSRIKVFASQEDNVPVGETQQQWHPWRRRYNVFQNRTAEDAFEQFARIDGGFLAWDFWLKDRNDRLVATINRNFAGLGRELFTDTGQYVIRFDAAGTEVDAPPGSSVSVQGQTLILPDRGDGGLTLDQRAMTLATAVSIDFDFFSRHSGSGGMGIPFFMWGGGDGSSEARRDSGSSDTGLPGAPGGPGAVGAGAAGAAGAAAGAGGTPGTPQEEWTDEQIYGRVPAPSPGQAQEAGAGAWPPAGPPQDPPTPGQQAEGFDYPPDFPGPEEEVMQDPWAEQSQDDGGGWGLFGNDGLFGGGGGSWGDS